MKDSDAGVRYVPLDPDAARTEPAKRLPFDLSTLSVTGLVIICEIDDPPPGNSRPTMSMKMTQFLRLSDESMIRLDMDRGVNTFKYGYTEPVSWKRTSADVISEVLTLVQGDEPDPGVFPWEEYSQAAKLRGISVEAETLRDLPHTVLFSDELATIFEF
ncbi:MULTISPECIES: hypothetical protein [unclassified Microbacterium]|uniref:hypothetical protein n=1 Tax=unclassified Microbacterium TaxID=2609290 RepID=UPI00214C1A2B|nr:MULTISPECIES: hypothetical protein [unclassified Microbacterium]MCR2784014.1 hypothetical protein [Microbacterium sp. zg.B96]WIM15144.1 hypothetical protein QNO11_11390 [Microbacterium sp. zg-B96]